MRPGRSSAAASIRSPARTILWSGSIIASRRSEPETRGQQSVHEATLRQFDTFLQTRLERLYTVVSSMPSAMWYTVVLGAILNFVFLWLFNLSRGNHLLLGGMVSFFTGTLIRLIALLDNAYRGDDEVSVSPRAFELAYQQMLQD
jgi:hypothetical protein